MLIAVIVIFILMLSIISNSLIRSSGSFRHRIQRSTLSTVVRSCTKFCSPTTGSKSSSCSSTATFTNRSRLFSSSISTDTIRELPTYASQPALYNTRFTAGILLAFAVSKLYPNASVGCPIFTDNGYMLSFLLYHRISTLFRSGFS